MKTSDVTDTLKVFAEAGYVLFLARVATSTVEPVQVLLCHNDRGLVGQLKLRPFPFA